MTDCEVERVFSVSISIFDIAINQPPPKMRREMRKWKKKPREMGNQQDKNKTDQTLSPRHATSAL
jgi:hypothetical protein